MPCEQGESSPLPLAAEAESLACYVNCLSITAALLCPGMHHVGCNGPYNLPHPMFWEGWPSTDAMGGSILQAPAMAISCCNGGGPSTAALRLFL